MDEQGKYARVWKKYIPVIRIKMKQAVASEQQLMLDEIDFKMGGKKAVSGYSFNLEMDKGSVSNNIAGAIAARTLLDVLREDTVCRELLSKHRVKINLDRRFCLRMEIAAAADPKE
jgi:hypothetical protein